MVDMTDHQVELLNTIDFVTIASTGNAVDFGDLEKQDISACITNSWIICRWWKISPANTNDE